MWWMVTPATAALMSLDCVISYYTLGTVASMVDRGRLLGQLDDELLGICQPPNTEKTRLHTISERGLGHERVLEPAGV